MYMLMNQDDRTRQSGLRGFAQPAEDEYKKSLEAILKALQLNPVDGYLKASPARRRLQEGFASVPPAFALKLANQILSEEGSLERLFRHRLHRATQRAMLGILVKKAQEFQQREKEELRREQEAIRQKLCESFSKQEQLINQFCSQERVSPALCANLKLIFRRDRLMSGVSCR